MAGYQLKYFFLFDIVKVKKKAGVWLNRKNFGAMELTCLFLSQTVDSFGFDAAGSGRLSGKTLWCGGAGCQSGTRPELNMQGDV